MLNLYVARIEIFNSADFDEKEYYCLLPAESYPSAAQIILDEWGADNIIGMELHCVSDDIDCSSVTISKSMANAFLHDIVSEVKCEETNYLKNMKGRT